MVDSNLKSIDFEWAALKERILNQRKTRPRGIGCNFRFTSPEIDQSAYTKEDMEEIKAFLLDEINHQMSQSNDELFVFLGALWNSGSRVRIGSPILIEAPSMQCAANIAELHFNRQKHETVLTDWCPAIYET